MNKPSETANLHLVPPNININLNDNAKWAVIVIGTVIILFSLLRLIKSLKKD